MRLNEVRIVHVHVPKTAGTALRAAFEMHYNIVMRAFTEYDEAKYENINPADYDFYSGHIGYNTARKLGGQIVTVLRNPVDRFVSVYYFWRQLYEDGVERSANTALAAKFSLDQFVQIKDQPGLIEEFHNRCTWQLAYGSSLDQRHLLRSHGYGDDALFAMATSNVAAMAAVGVQEDLSSFAASLKRKFGIDLAIEKVNVTAKRPALADVDMATRRAIQDWVYMDIELYHHVLNAR